MDALDLARWQFGITTVYHFLFVPITLSLVWFVVGFQTAWYRSGNEKYLRLTRFFGELFLINFAMGVVTGIVQEFQFGMNWSDYSRFVGDIFGAPLAVEGLLAFFLESTFLGLWIFGWDKLPKKAHLATIWLAAIGTSLSAYIILAANAWMQHPVGFEINEAAGRAELKDFFAVVFNNTAVLSFPHTLGAAFMAGGALVLGVSVWRILRKAAEEAPIFRTAAKAGAWALLAGAVVVTVTGDLDGKMMTEQQPMKMAAAEALYTTEQPAAFSLFTIGTPDGKSEVFSIKVPNVLSFLATGDFNGKVEGINDLQARYATEYAGVAPAGTDFAPPIPVTYWTFRWMIGAGFLAALAAAWFLWKLRKGGVPTKGALRISIVLPFLPLAAISFGWLFTEIGRQPWIVFGQMTTASAVSPNVGALEVALTMVGFTALYGVLAVVEMGLLLKRIKADLPKPVAGGGPDGDAADRPMTFAY